MVAHEDIGVEKAFAAVFIDGEGLEILLEVCGVFEYLLLLVAASDDVVEKALSNSIRGFRTIEEA